MPQIPKYTPQQAAEDIVEMPPPELPRGGSMDTRLRSRAETSTRAFGVQATMLRLAGLTFHDIGERLGVSDDTARLAVKRHLDRAEAWSAAELRKVGNARLDRAQAAIWSKVLHGDLAAVQAFLRLSERRARLNGLDAPTAIAIGPDVRVEMERAITDLEVVLGEVVAQKREDVEEADDDESSSGTGGLGRSEVGTPTVEGVSEDGVCPYPLTQRLVALGGVRWARADRPTDRFKVDVDDLLQRVLGLLHEFRHRGWNREFPEVADGCLCRGSHGHFTDVAGRGVCLLRWVVRLLDRPTDPTGARPVDDGAPVVLLARDDARHLLRGRGRRRRRRGGRRRRGRRGGRRRVAAGPTCRQCQTCEDSGDGPSACAHVRSVTPAARGRAVMAESPSAA